MASFVKLLIPLVKLFPKLFVFWVRLFVILFNPVFGNPDVKLLIPVFAVVGRLFPKLFKLVLILLIPVLIPLWILLVTLFNWFILFNPVSILLTWSVKLFPTNWFWFCKFILLIIFISFNLDNFSIGTGFTNL